MFKKALLIFTCTLLSLSLSAQLADFPMTKLGSNDFKVTKWQRSEVFSLHPDKGNFKQVQGNKVWWTEAQKAILVSKKNFGEVKLRFQLLQSNRTRTHLVFQNSYKVEFNTDKDDATLIAGSIISPQKIIKKPYQNALKAEGLWNEVEIVFVPSDGKKPARIEYLDLNGIRIQSNVFLDDLANPSKTPIRFINLEGITAIKNIEYLSFEIKKPLRLGKVHYSVKPEQDWVKTYDKNQEGIINGTLEKLSHELPHDFKQYQTVYQADLFVKEDGTYGFTIDYTGKAKLYIDNEEIVGSEARSVRKTRTGIKKLSKGVYELQYVYQKVWRPAQLGLYFSGSTFRPYAVHSPRSLKIARLSDGIYVHPEKDRPQILRSFMMHKGQKKTEVISVGTKEKIHYSIDLDTGSLLHAWRGRFADVTEMWYNRGEPQILKPLGLNIELPGAPFVFDAYMSTIEFDKYVLNPTGNPTFKFNLGDTQISKSLKPSKEGLQVVLESNAESPLTLVLASGDTIESLSENLYKVDGQYYIYTGLEKAQTQNNKVEVLEGDEMQLLMYLPKNVKSATYKIRW